MAADLNQPAERAHVVEAGLARVRTRIDAAARAAGRDPGSVTLIAVTKSHPAADAETLAGLGVVDLGENRVDELAAKAAELRLPGRVRWHFVGQLQTNKVNRLVRVPGLCCVHSVDRPRLVDALSRAVRPHRPDEPLGCFVQVDLGLAEADATAERKPGSRGGASPASVPALADAVAAADGLELRGLMAVAPLDGNPADAFARLRSLSERVLVDHPEAGAISAGMSGDLELAVAAGATHVRVGTAILQARAPLR